MSNRKDKERWKKISDNKKKCCSNCTQLFKLPSGDYGCSFITSKDGKAGACVIIEASDIDKPHSCYDKYNGKNT